ncbi:hypothetical protein A1OO_13745 [Enterovibrio norvegicus FF-33]|uniref:hypothetical protein n=1 Tax=Enterovibrio norvegicus TaxID=188144 RepID=UPI0002D37CD2|nr:hypothetical protein [Enterovibrio norvegicus]OEE66824.1 hypothetical protein A1OO_13745 [Enterovibrio norvegicus FF-33]OEE76539.1 hypothetical protein A1OQ_05945 [Enterovibrio norvegicus FF-162]
MKKSITAIVLLMALSGCEDATKIIDQAQEAANQAVDGLQENVESVDLSQLSLDQFGDAAGSAQALAASIQEAADADFADPTALVEVREHIANAYSCLVDATSESTAEKLLNSVLSSISSEDALSVIDNGIEKAKAAQECVM